MNLVELAEGENAIIKNCSDINLLKNGFTAGTPIKIYKKISWITCVYIRGAIIAARKKDYAKILVEKMDDSKQYKPF